MKNLVILGGGTAGTTVANQLVGKLPSPALYQSLSYVAPFGCPS